MLPSIAVELARRGTARASLAVLGARLHQLDLFAPIRTGVRIAQKVVRFTPPSSPSWPAPRVWWS